MFKKYKTIIIVVIIFNLLVLLNFILDFENILGLQLSHPDMDYYEINNGLYYYTSYENGLFTYDPNTETIKKLSDESARHSSMTFYNGFIFFIRYRGNSIIRMDIDGDNSQVMLYKTVHNYELADNKLFYINMDDRRLYSCDLDGKNSELVIDAKFSGLKLEKNYLYLIGYKNQKNMRYYYENGEIKEADESLD